MSRKRGLWMVTAAVFLAVGATPVQPPAAKDDIWARGPISAVGHGSFFDQQGRAITLTPEFVVQAQRYYLASLHKRADAVQKGRFSAFKRSLLGGQPLASSQPEQVFADAALTSWLIDRVKPSKSAHLGSINSALRAEYERLTGSTFTPSAKMLQAIQTERPGGVSVALSTGASGQAYIDACRNAGVPIPPSWGTFGTSAWRSRGILTDAQEFISAELQAEVFTFESTSPRGICYALPRSQGNSIFLLGIICQGNDTGNACFWDNQVNDVNVPIQKGTIKPLVQFAGGHELFNGGGGVCTECHTGENAFIIHPGTALDVAGRMPSVWHKPMVHPEWPANPGPNTLLARIPLPAGQQSCLACHTNTGAGRLPHVSTEVRGYCDFILGPSMNRTMPPGSPGHPSFNTHKTALLDSCQRPPSQGPLDPVGGDTIAVWRPSSGMWFVKNHKTGGTTSQQWGVSGDVPVPADYDGDGTTDFAVWRPSNGHWFVIESRTGASWSREWGIAGDVPVPMNYRTAPADGVELAIWRPSTGVWWILNRRTNHVETRQWGTAGDIPKPGSYETVPVTIIGITIRIPTPGLTVWRPSTGTWFVQNVGNSATAQRVWGVHTDIPAPGDFNGDGRVDLAIWRPSDGTWHILNSSFTGATSGNTSRVVQWGTRGDVPVPNDYDRDNITDIAVWRPSTGNWHIIRSTDGAHVTHQWGTNGDIPVRYRVASPQ